MSLKGKDFISLYNLSRRDIESIFEKTHYFKKYPFGDQLKNKNIVMLFAKPSTRTRVSFEVAINQLGGDDIFLPLDELQFSRGESIEDTARVLSRYCDGIVARLFKHETMLSLAKHSSVPVINGLTDLLHPCQALADLFTVQEKLGKPRGMKLAFVGDGNNNVTHSLMHICSLLGVDLSIACPKGFHPRKEIIQNFLNNSQLTHASLEITDSPQEAVKEADAVYTDTWISMGEEEKSKERIKIFRKFQLNRDLLKHATKNALVMHDLPAHRGLEITTDVMDSSQSVIWDQAENRLHVEKALLALIFGK